MQKLLNILFWVLISVVAVMIVFCLACGITALIKNQSFFELLEIWIKAIFTKAPAVEETARFLIK